MNDLSENGTKTANVEENGSEVEKKEVLTPNSEEKVEQKTTEQLREERKELEKTNPELIARTKANAKAPSKSKRKPRKRAVNTQTQIGGDIMDKRTKAEKVLVAEAKKAKRLTKRINAKAGSKSGQGALQGLHSDGSCKVSVRSNDIVIFAPHSYVKYGTQHPGIWVHVTRIAFDDPNMGKAFAKAFKDKKSSADWSKELAFKGRQQGASKTLTADQVTAQRKEAEAKVKELKAMERKAKKATPKAKASTSKRADAMKLVKADA